MGKPNIHIRVVLKPEDPLYEKFEQLKAEFGVNDNVNTVRSLISRHRLRRTE